MALYTVGLPDEWRGNRQGCGDASGEKERCNTGGRLRQTRRREGGGNTCSFFTTVFVEAGTDGEVGGTDDDEGSGGEEEAAAIEDEDEDEDEEEEVEEEEGAEGQEAEGVAADDAMDTAEVDALGEASAQGAQPRPLGNQVGAPLAESWEAAEHAPTGAPPREGSQKRAWPCKYFARGKCRNGEQCRFSHDGEGGAAKKQKRAAPAVEEEGSRRRPSLLKALLAKEIRTERSLLLQCFRRLVRKLDEQGPRAIAS